MQQLLRLKPLYQERVWGGRGLQTSLKRALPEDRPIGESWEIVDRPEAQSIIINGGLKGQTLRSAIAQNGREIMGPNWAADRPFPILVKWLDCRERLSLQVHPPASVAQDLKGEPKTENWYIAEAAPGSHLIVGLKRGVTRAQFEAAIKTSTLEECVHRFPVSAGDSILVHSGQVHAIDGGNLILEIQQNSDTTYRVYDWGRTGLDGKPRQMHISESLRSILWDDFEPKPVRASSRAPFIAEAKEFTIRKLPMESGERVTFESGEEPRILSVVTGTLQEEGGSSEVLTRGDNVILPYASTSTFFAQQASMLLLTEKFS